MALRNRTKKFTGSLKKLSEQKYLICKECKMEEVQVSGDTAAVTCARCVQRMIVPPPTVQKKADNEKFPRGWHFKKRYVHTDGKVYVRGVLTDETDIPPKKTTKRPKVNKRNVQVTK